MSNETYHIRREQPGAKIEALCGAKPAEDAPLVCGPPSLTTCWQCITLQCGRPLPPYPKTPEHDRLEKAKITDDATQLVGDFVAWLSDEKKLVMGRWNDNHELIPARENIQRLLADYFGVNENSLESEKRALLEHMRAVNSASKWALSEGRAILAHQGSDGT